MCEDNELLRFHLKKHGFDLELDFQGPARLLERAGDADYEIALRMMRDKLDIAGCSFEEVGVSQFQISSIRSKGAQLFAFQIVSMLMSEPGCALNAPRIEMLAREIAIAKITLSDLLTERAELIRALPEAGDSLARPLIPTWQRRECEKIIMELAE